MKTYTEKIVLHTRERVEFVNITNRVREIVRKSGVKEGLVLVNAMHITSSVFINDNESGLIEDYKAWLATLAPPYKDARYKHNLTGEDNAYAHLWRTILGRDVTIAITNGNLDFGPWESIWYAEFDGQRQKRIMVKVIGD